MVTTPRVKDGWYVVALSDDLKRAPVRRDIFEQPLVLFRDAANKACCLLDRCAHRNVPLSEGRLIQGRVECLYHGWQFDGQGYCRKIPTLCTESEGKGRRVPAFATYEQDGLVWVYADAEQVPNTSPPSYTFWKNPAYTTVHYQAVFESTLLAAAENILDVPHTAFLHKGLFRGGAPHPIDVIVRRNASRVEAEYQGEPRPSGLVGKLLAPKGGSVEHWDRFILPSTAQVEYRLGENSHLVITNFLTPEATFLTRLYSVASFKLPWMPTKLLKRVMLPLAKKIVAQDAEVLKLQSDTIKNFGEEAFVSTQVDVMGPHIQRLLRQAERGETTSETFEDKLQLMV